MKVLPKKKKATKSRSNSMDKEETPYEGYPLSQKAAEGLYPEFAEMDKNTANDTNRLQSYYYEPNTIDKSEILGAVFIKLSEGMAIIRWLENTEEWRWELYDSYGKSKTLTGALEDIHHFLHEKNKSLKKSMWMYRYEKEASVK